MDVVILITGTSPLLMHNDRLASPLDPYARSLKIFTGKRVKTDADYEEMAKIEFKGGLYWNQEIGPYVPGSNVLRCLVEGARLTKQGKSVERAVSITETYCPLIYNGPREVDKLYQDKNNVHQSMVKIGSSRNLRTRPMFRDWKLEVPASLDLGLLESLETFSEICVAAGRSAGLGDWRPSSPHGGTFGRFEAEVIKI